ncbi:hypothetical protein HO291_003476 [Salmonella enterica]|nr:hypothetical protein [Salmonella enterica]
MATTKPSSQKPQNLPTQASATKPYYNSVQDEVGTWEEQARKLVELEARIKALEPKGP